MSSASSDQGPMLVAAPPAVEVKEFDARQDWERRIYTRLVDTADADPGSALPAPTNLHAVPGTGHVRLSWDAVPGAAGYVVERSAGVNEPPTLLHHGGSDVAAVSTTEFADTGLLDDMDYSYRVGAVAGG